MATEEGMKAVVKKALTERIEIDKMALAAEVGADVSTGKGRAAWGHLLTTCRDEVTKETGIDWRPARKRGGIWIRSTAKDSLRRAGGDVRAGKRKGERATIKAEAAIRNATDEHTRKAATRRAENYALMAAATRRAPVQIEYANDVSPSEDGARHYFCGLCKKKGHNRRKCTKKGVDTAPVIGA